MSATASGATPPNLERSVVRLRQAVTRARNLGYSKHAISWQLAITEDFEDFCILTFNN